MSTSITPIIPWDGLKRFITSYPDIFQNKKKVSLCLDFEIKNNKPKKYKTKIIFNNPLISTKINGIIKSSLGIISKFKLFLNEKTGQITLPQFNSSVELRENDYLITTPDNCHPDIKTFTESALLALRRIIESIADGDDKVRGLFNQLMLKKDPHKYN